MEPRFDRSHFRHSFEYRVRSHECDRQGVVHNARYLEMLEIARIEYCREVLGIVMDATAFVEHDRFVFVHNSMDYFSPARFDDLLRVHTRVTRIGRTSVALEQIMDDATTGRRVLEAKAVMVAVDPISGEPVPIDNERRRRAEAWEVAIDG